MNEKIKMMLVGLFLSLDNEIHGSTEHISETISFKEIKDVMVEEGETELAEMMETYFARHKNNLTEDESGELYDEMYSMAYPNGRWAQRW